MAPTEMSKSGRMQVVPSARAGGWLYQVAARVSVWWQLWRAGNRQS